MKQLTKLKHILKLSTKRLKRENWDLKVTLEEATELKEVVALGDSQLFRFIEKMTGVEEDVECGKYKYNYNKHLVAVVCTGKTDFKRACKGFSINGIKYKRILGTSGGVKKNTVFFINEILYEEISKKIDNGRNRLKELVPAKFEAYRALVASQSAPVTMPNGILVVKDCITKFEDEVIYLDDSDGNKEPLMEYIENFLVELNTNDGFGLCTPELMKQWCEDIQEDFVSGGLCIRNAFTKGMVYPFDIVQFAKEVAHTYKVVDIWGYEHDIRNIQLVLTESMLKLWDSYDSIEDYIDNCKENGYEFGVCKVSPKQLEDIRDLNYQYLQSYELTDEDVKELCKPTVEWLKQALCGDYEATLNYLGVGEREPSKGDMDYVEALCANPEMMKDSFVVYKVARSIKKKIDDAKIGKLRCHGNYQVISGDPYTLCQSMFDIQPTGLLKRGEVYSSYWNDNDVEEVLMFRSPMTSHNNIRKGRLNSTQEAKKWYKYMYNIMILNSWDTITMAENGAD